MGGSRQNLDRVLAFKSNACHARRGATSPEDEDLAIAIVPAATPRSLGMPVRSVTTRADLASAHVSPISPNIIGFHQA